MRPGILTSLTTLAIVCGVALTAGCSPASDPAPESSLAARPSLLLITLDTTRADSLGYEGASVSTPNLDTLAASGDRFSNAYTTAPTTLPSHASILTGLYPYEHFIHENSRPLSGDIPLVQERLRELGYDTAAFISGFPLSREFGLARGFDRYDDQLDDDGVERSAANTTRSVARFLDQRARPGTTSRPLFLWVHYYDPHDPYEPPPPYDQQYDDPYLGEIAALDEQLGILLAAWRAVSTGPETIIVVGDHGEGRGDWGETLHGNLLSQGVMRVPLILSRPENAEDEQEVIDEPVSVRRVFDALLASAEGAPPEQALLEPDGKPVLAEAMKPYLQYGWQPQVMAVSDTIKVVRAGDLEVFDLSTDPLEQYDLAPSTTISNDLRQALRSYPIPDPSAARSDLRDQSRDRLASLGYVTWDGVARSRPDAPRPRDMAPLFADLDRGSGLFVAGRYREAIQTFERVAARDPGNLMVALRLATANSLIGDSSSADRWFERALDIDSSSIDVKHYRGLHLMRIGNEAAARPLLEEVLEANPGRAGALRQLARAHANAGRIEEATDLLQRLDGTGASGANDLTLLADLFMATGRTDEAIATFERAEGLAGDQFARLLELGVLYLADNRFEDARDALDRIGPDHPQLPMVAFKRAQVSCLLGELDRRERVQAAIAIANDVTRPLIARERLFEGLR